MLERADSALFLWEILRNLGENRAFRRENPQYPTPPAPLAFDAYNHVNWPAYQETGRTHADLVSGLVAEFLTSAERVRILEWGCGPGRVLRHLDRIPGFDHVERTGTDYNADSIAWCRKALHGIRFEPNSLEPPLPLDAESFDCVYAISIFTHLSERNHHAWMHELLRVLRPGGVLIFTTHGDRCASRLVPEELALYHAGKLVVKDRVQEGKKLFAAYQPPEYVRGQLVGGHAVLRHIEDARKFHLAQDVWCVRKRVDPDPKADEPIQRDGSSRELS
jgi:SAM-dependent methyltransferase